jgi:hypothetical protein
LDGHCHIGNHSHVKLSALHCGGRFRDRDLCGNAAHSREG